MPILWELPGADAKAQEVRANALAQALRLRAEAGMEREMREWIIGILIFILGMLVQKLIDSYIEWRNKDG